jgi:hypothetical protein
MSDSEDWIYSLVPASEVEDLKNKMERAYDDENTLFNVVLSAPRSSAISLCKMFASAEEGDMIAFIGLISFVSSIVTLIEQELENDGINPYEE